MFDTYTIPPTTLAITSLSPLSRHSVTSPLSAHARNEVLDDVEQQSSVFGSPTSISPIVKKGKEKREGKKKKMIHADFEKSSLLFRRRQENC